MPILIRLLLVSVLLKPLPEVQVQSTMESSTESMVEVAAMSSTVEDLLTPAPPTLHSFDSAPMAVIWVFVLAAGLLFNVVIIVTFSSNTLRTPQNLFFIMLAVNDFIVLLTGIPPVYVILTGSHGRDFYIPPYCEIYAFFITFSSFASMNFIAAIGVTRFISICYPRLKGVLFTWPKCITASVVICLYNAAYCVPALSGIGLGRFAYSEKMFLCGYDFVYSFAYNIVLVIGTYGLVCVEMLVCYLKIYLVFRKSKQRVGQSSDGKGSGGSKVKKSEYRLAIQLLIIFIIYNVAWGPVMALLFIADPYGRLSVRIYEPFVILAYCNSMVNAPLYMYFHKVFRSEVLRIFFRKK